MEFTKKVKNQLENANSREEVQGILDETRKNAEDAGVLLSDEDLDAASGGSLVSKNSKNTKLGKLSKNSKNSKNSRNSKNGSNTGGWLMDLHTDK